jgi:hypothetical protein
MSWELEPRRSTAAPSLRWLVATLLALTACGSSAKTTSPASVLGDRRELPAVPVTPVDAGALRSSVDEARPPAFPRALALSALAEGERIADLAVLAQGDRFLLAWVTYFDGGGPALRATSRGGKQRTAPAPQSQRGASVVVRALDAEGEALGTPNVISVKADSIGGVSLAPAPSVAGEAALAWVGNDAGVGQVFVTRLSRSGEKQAQRMLTRSKEGCSDVALVGHKDGFIVAYVDSRDGGPGVYTAKIGKDLQRVGAERLVARAKGEASDVRMLVRGDELVVAWAEARQNPQLFGIFAARLLAGDLSLRGDATRVVLGPQHAKGVELSPLGDGVALGWVEDAPIGVVNAPRTAALMRLGPALRSDREPVRIALPVQASSLALDCEPPCRVVVAGSEGDELAFYGFSYDGNVAQPAARLAAIPAVSTEDTNPVVARDWLFFAEDNLHGAGRIRKAKLVWR